MNDDALCQIGFCVAPAHCATYDPITEERVLACLHHYAELHRMRVDLRDARLALAHQTWLTG